MKRNFVGLGGAVLLGAGILVSGCNANNAAQNTGAQTVADEHAGHDHAAKSEDSHDAKAHTHGTKMTVTSEPKNIVAGQPAKLTLQITDDAGKPVEKFAVVHEKQLHQIVVSKDLEWFNHEHPVYSNGGKFAITTTFPRAGTYKLFADYKPEGGEADVATHVFTVGGPNPRPAQAKLVADKIVNGWITKKVTSAPEGQPDAKGGATYTVKLMPMPMNLKVGQKAIMHFQIEDASGKPLTDIEPYLGALGHCVILSQDAETYLHTHPSDGGHEGHDHEAMSSESGEAHAGHEGHEGHESHAAKPVEKGGPDVMFHTEFPKAGLYKVWGQFQHKGKIITAPFVVKVG
jgi:hypothetical protein